MVDQTLPKKIKYAKRNNYAEKRRPYKSYLSAKWMWSDIFIELDELSKTSSTYLIDISKKYGINYKTLSNKYYKHRNSKDDRMHINDENRGGQNKVFTVDDEKRLYDNIKKNLLIRTNLSQMT